MCVPRIVMVSAAKHGLLGDQDQDQDATMHWDPDTKKLAHLALLVTVSVAGAFVQTHWLDWHQDAVFPWYV